MTRQIDQIKEMLAQPDANAAPCAELQAKITEQAALIEKMDIENTSCRVRIGTLNAQLTTQADSIKALEAECRKLRDALSETEAFCKRKDITIERHSKVIELAKTALAQTREELRACQAAIHLCGGFDPRYVSDAQAAMRVADAELSTINALPAVKPFQSRVNEFVVACFGGKHANNIVERNHRFLEEAIELVQSTGCTQDEAHQLVDYVFGRPVGEPYQEVGGVMVTLAALCSANGLSMVRDGETELARVWTVIEKIRAKQAAKPRLSPLPGARVEA